MNQVSRERIFLVFRPQHNRFPGLILSTFRGRYLATIPISRKATSWIADPIGTKLTLHRYRRWVVINAKHSDAVTPVPYHTTRGAPIYAYLYQTEPTRDRSDMLILSA